MAKKTKGPGWVKISRSLLDSDIWNIDEPHNARSAWIDLILMMNFEDKTFITKHNTIITVKRGSTFTSIQHLADRWRWSKARVRRFITLLKKLGMIEYFGTPDGTTISLVKYRDFQDARHTDESADESADESRLKNIKNEKNDNKRSRAPVSMKDTMKALDEWARKGGSE